MPRGGILPPTPVLGPGSALGSRPRVALSSARAPPVYSGPRPSGNSGISRLPARRGGGVRPGWRLGQEDVHGPAPTGGSSWCGVRCKASYDHHVLSVLPGGGLPATGSRHLRPPICPATFLKRCPRALQGAPSEVPRG